MENDTKIINWELDFWYTTVIVSAVFVSDTVSYIVLRGLWYNTIVLNVHVPSNEKGDDSNNSFYEELEQVFFYHFSKYHIKILLGDFNTKVGKENIFKPTVGNEGLHQDSDDNCVRLVKSQHKKSGSKEHDVPAPKHS